MRGIPTARTERWGTALGVLALTLGLMFADPAPWHGSWGETTASIERTTALSYPLVAAAAAWVAARPNRQRFAALLEGAARPPTAIWAWTCFTVFASAAVGLGLASAGAAAVTAHEATYGSPDAAAAISLLAGCFLASALGTATGRYLPAVVAPAAAAAVVYFVGLGLDTGSPGLAPFAALVVADPRERTFLHVEGWAYLLRATFLSALALWLLAVAARSIVMRRVCMIAVCLTATPLLYVGADVMTVQASAVEPVCLRGEPTICMTSARFHVAADVQSIGREVMAALPGLFPDGLLLLEDQLTARGAALSSKEHVVTFSTVNGVHGEAHIVDRDDLVLLLSNRLLRDKCPSPAQSLAGDGQMPRVPATANMAIQRALLRELRVQLDAPDIFDAPEFSENAVDWSVLHGFDIEWDSMKGPQRRDWLTKHGKGVLTCSVDSRSATL